MNFILFGGDRGVVFLVDVVVVVAVSALSLEKLEVVVVLTLKMSLSLSLTVVVTKFRNIRTTFGRDLSVRRSAIN